MVQTRLPPPSDARMLALAARRSAPTAPIAGKPATIIRKGADSSDASITGVHTALLTLTPSFLDALRKVAPKRRGSKIPYVVLLAVLAVVAVLGADPSTREFGITKGRQIAARLHRAPAAKPVEAPAATAVAQAAAPVDAPPVVNAAPVVQGSEPAAAPVVTFGAARKSTKQPPGARSNSPRPRPASRHALAAISVAKN